MSETDKIFAGSIPQFYDTYLVPLIFESYAADLARRVAASKPGTILETAAGSGVVPRALAPLLPADAQYTVTDLNQPMLDHAAKLQSSDTRISWQQADALALPFADGSFDTVCCQFGVMFYPDRQRGFAEALRVLKPGGAFVFNTWDRISENEFADVVTQVASTVFPDDPPMFLARTPHGYHDKQVIEQDLRQAGFSAVEIVTVSGTSRANSAREPALAYCQGTPLRNEIEARNASLLETVTDTAAEAIAQRYGHGPVAAKIQGHVVVAKA